MTEDQANEFAMRLTLALIESGKTDALFVRQTPRPQDVAKPFAELVLAIRDTLLGQTSSSAPSTPE